MKKIDTEINKLLNETKIKLSQNRINESVILIDFVKEYNKLWSDYENDKEN
jgi:hypothetical protein